MIIILGLFENVMLVDNLPIKYSHYGPLMKSDPSTSPEQHPLPSPHHLTPPSVRGHFKRVLSAQSPELQTTVASIDARKTLPQNSLEEPFLLARLESLREWPEYPQQELGFDRFSVRFKKVEMTPSFLMEKHLLTKPTQEDHPETPLPCIVLFNGKAIETSLKVQGGQLLFSNGCSIRLSKVTKAKVAYQDYQKCLWLTYAEGQSQGWIQEAKLRIHVPHDVKDDLYAIFSRVLIQKLALLGSTPSAPPAEDTAQSMFRMEGPLFKRSQILGKWAQRKIVVTDCIQSFKGGRCTFSMRNLRELWTRFDRHQNCLIVKIRHGSEKTELGMPIVPFPQRFCSMNWLYRVYRLLAATLS